MVPEVSHIFTLKLDNHCGRYLIRLAIGQGAKRGEGDNGTEMTLVMLVSDSWCSKGFRGWWVVV